MKLSDLRKKIDEAMAEGLGDLDVVMLTDEPSGVFCIDDDPHGDIIQIPIDPYKPTELKTVFAVAWASCVPAGDDDADHQDAGPDDAQRRLTLVVENP